MQQPDSHAVISAQTRGRKERNRGKRVEPKDRHPARTGPMVSGAGHGDLTCIMAPLRRCNWCA